MKASLQTYWDGLHMASKLFIRIFMTGTKYAYNESNDWDPLLVILVEKGPNMLAIPRFLLK